MEIQERKPLVFITVIGAIIVLILGAGVISMYYGKREPAPHALTESPYEISWGDGRQYLLVEGSQSQPVEAKFSLFDVRREQVDGKNALALGVWALILDTASSTKKICAWKLPLNIRRVADENGTLAAPSDTYLESTTEAPACIVPKEPLLIGKKITFPVPASEDEFVFTTGDPSNLFFSVRVSATGTIHVERAPQEIPG